MTPTDATPTISPENVKWLRSRGTGDDLQLDDLAFLVQVRLVLRFAPMMLPGMLLEVALDHPRLRERRSRPGSIGAYASDSDWLTGRAMVAEPLLWRGLGAAAAVSGALLSDFPWAATTLLGVACFLMLAGRVTGSLGIAAAIVSLVVHPHGWSWTVVALYAAMMLALARSAVRATSGAMGPGLGFVPLLGVVALGARGVWSSFALGVDKAQSDDARRAEPFLATAEPRAGAYLPVILHSRALVLARSGDTTAALRLLSTPPDPSPPTTTRGWCALVLGDILALAGQDEAAIRQFQTAITLLAGRRARGVRVAAQLRLVDAAIKQGQLDLALDALTSVRWHAVRRGHLDLVATTEGYLVQMMLAVGNRAGAIWTLEQVSPPDARRHRPSEAGSRTALWSVLHSQVALEAGDLGEAERHAANGVKRADLLADVAPRAAAHLTLAEVRRATGSVEDALPHALTAIDTLQRIRYALPASSWRRNWVALNAHAYELALDLASSSDDAELMAELIETVRAQAVPVGLDRAGGSLQSFVAALLDPHLDGMVLPPQGDVGRGTRAVSAALSVAGVDPVQPPSAIYVGGDTWVSKSASSVVDLDHVVTRTIGARGWYWTACIAAGSYWWTARSPAGAWSWGSTPLAAGSPGRLALEDLLSALPIRRPGESKDEFEDRMAASPLMATPAELAPGTSLLARLTEAFVPSVLLADLIVRDPDDPVRLLVSLNGALSALPVNALPVVGAVAIIDVATVSHMPAAAVFAELDLDSSVRPEESTGIALAVVDPAPGYPELTAARAPRGATIVLRRPATRQAVLDALARADRHGVFCAFAHYEVPPVGVPASGGLAVADGALSLRDLLAEQPAHLGLPRVPERVLLAICESISAGASDAVRAEASQDAAASAWEWLGLSAGFLLAGARYVVATPWPIPDGPRTTQFDHAIAEGLTMANPAAGVRDALLRLAPPERRGRLPVLVWAAYAYLGPVPDPEPTAME